jgi:uncharacterized protein (TIGR04255 family)
VPEGTLPSFRKPPVTEVVLAASFKSLTLSIPDIGLLWEAFRSKFPIVEEHPPYEPPTEMFEPGFSGPPISFEISPTPPLPRIWMLSEDQTELLQLQRNWFACNWRKVEPEDKYGRWPSRWDSFKRSFGILESHVEDRALGVLRTQQCEVTYINHILPGRVWSNHGELFKIFRPVAAFRVPPATAEQVNFAASFVIPGDDGNPVGRLHLTVQPALRKQDSIPIFVMNLTARGAPEGQGIEGIKRFMERAHVWVVRGFTELTTPEIHEEWQRNA